jgi:glycosyltransferase involved in cell wall biosynthesis
MNSPLRVLIVLDSLNRGGAETMVMNLLNHIDRNKVIYDFAIHTQKSCDYEEEALQLGAIIYRFPRFNGRNFLEYGKAWNSFFREHEEYSIVHGHLSSSGFLYMSIAKKRGCYVIIHSHTAKFRGGVAGILSAIYNYPNRYIANYLFGCSTAAGILRYGKKAVAKSNYTNLFNAIDTGRFTFRQPIRDQIRKEFGMGTKTVYITVARMHEAKNPLGLIAIFKAIKNKKDDSVLLWVGDGNLRDKIVQQIHMDDLDNDIILTGVRSDIPDLLFAADAFLFPSLWEGLPVVVIEAAATGLPCFISDTITKEVCISPLIKQISISTGVQPWVDALIDFKPIERTDQSEIIKSAGYDISDTSQWLTSFYLNKAATNELTKYQK